MDHQLILEHRKGCYEAHCSCGGWHKEPVALRVSLVREIYPRVRKEHRQHAEKSTPHIFPPPQF
jgi:hypothetical protein